MNSQDFKDKLELIKLIGEAQGIMRGLILNNSITNHEKEVCKKWITKSDKHFDDKLKENL